MKVTRDDRGKRSDSLSKQLQNAVKGDDKGEGVIPKKAIQLEDMPKNVKGKRQHWGYHLLLDVSECNKGIDDEGHIRKFLKDLVKRLKMKAIGDPVLVHVDDEDGRG